MKITSLTEDQAAAEAIRMLATFRKLPAIEVETVYRPGAALHVTIHGHAACIVYGRRVELFRGLSLAASHGEDGTYETVQPCRFKSNGFMADCSRNGVLNERAVKKLIRHMALMGMDTLMLYTEDTYEIPEYPYFGYMRGRFTQEEIRRFDRYARGFGIELIPCIQTLAH